MAKRRGAYHHSITNPQKVPRRNKYKNYGFGLHLSNIRRSPGSTNKTCATQTVRGTLHSTDNPCSTADNVGIDPGPTNESTETVRGRLHYTDHLCRATDNNCSPPCSANKSSGTLESNKTVREKLHSTDNIFRTPGSTNQTTGPNMVRATGMIDKSSYTTSNGIFERKKDEDMIPIEVNKALKQKRLFLKRFDYLRNFYIRMIMKPGVRVDNVVMKQLKKEGMVHDKRKIIGPMPSIEVGECFNLRRKLMIMGIHTQLIHGIDYTTTARGRLIATSIVTSEGYGDVFLNSGELIYNGEGSTFERKKTRYADDQKLERGNLALKNCMETGSYVRVIRGLKIKGKKYAKKYVYDGLYRVVRCYKKQAKHGAMQWKFKLIRNSGQKTIDWKSFYYIYAS